MNQDDPSISFDELSLVYPDGTHALDGITFDVRRGAAVALVGPSGCGKSTLLRLVASFEAPTGGRLTTDAAADETIGYVFQDPTLLPWRTVVKNIELPARLAGVDRREARAKAMEAVHRVGLTGFEHHKPWQLSGGMRMRVSIARALTTQPRIFLFDEPFGALDEMTRERLNEELTTLFVMEPFAGLFVTHSVPESVFLSTRVIVLSVDPGRVVADIPVPFDYPRVPELRFEPEFVQLTQQVSTALRESGPIAA